MLRLLHPAIPPTWTVLVLADRGLYARWLFRRIVRVGWHPFLRINTRGTFRPTAQACFRALQTFVPQTGTSGCGRGTAFKSRDCDLTCTLLARWEDGHKDPWLILTDLPPACCDPAWYGLRMWIEIVCSQVTKTGVGAGLGCWDHVPNLHRAIRDNHAIDQQLDELPTLVKGRFLQADAQVSADGADRVSQHLDFAQTLALRRDFSFLN